MAFGVKRYSKILQDMATWIIANQSKVTDLNEGSVIRSYCEAVGLEVEQLYIKGHVGFERELKSVPFYAFDFSKQGGQKSAGSVVFSRTGTTGDAPISTGTLVSTTDGIQFETTADGTILNGNTDSSPVSIQALEAGKDSNVPASTITVIVTPVSGVETVNNTASTTGGQDVESDAEFLKRFQEHIEGLGKSNKTGLIAGAKSVSGVRSASAAEHFPPSSSYNATVYIDDGAGGASAALITSVENVLLGDGTASKPGYKAGGVNIRILAPTKVTVNLTMTITDDNSISEESIKYVVTEAVSDYINNLLIGEDVIRNKIIEAIMGCQGVLDVVLTVPAANTTVNSGEIGRTGTFTINFS